LREKGKDIKNNRCREDAIPFFYFFNDDPTENKMPPGSQLSHYKKYPINGRSISIDGIERFHLVLFLKRKDINNYETTVKINKDNSNVNGVAFNINMFCDG
jgi:hypothetical protein